MRVTSEQTSSVTLAPSGQTWNHADTFTRVTYGADQPLTHRACILSLIANWCRQMAAYWYTRWHFSGSLTKKPISAPRIPAHNRIKQTINEHANARVKTDVPTQRKYPRHLRTINTERSRLKYQPTEISQTFPMTQKRLSPNKTVCWKNHGIFGM